MGSGFFKFGLFSSSENWGKLKGGAAEPSFQYAMFPVTYQCEAAGNVQFYAWKTYDAGYSSPTRYIQARVVH